MSEVNWSVCSSSSVNIFSRRALIEDGSFWGQYMMILQVTLLNYMKYMTVSNSLCELLGYQGTKGSQKKAEIKRQIRQKYRFAKLTISWIDRCPWIDRETTFEQTSRQRGNSLSNSSLHPRNGVVSWKAVCHQRLPFTQVLYIKLYCQNQPLKSN